MLGYYRKVVLSAVRLHAHLHIPYVSIGSTLLHSHSYIIRVAITDYQGYAITGLCYPQRSRMGWNKEAFQRGSIFTYSLAILPFPWGLQNKQISIDRSGLRFSVFIKNNTHFLQQHSTTNTTASTTITTAITSTTTATPTATPTIVG